MSIKIQSISREGVEYYVDYIWGFCMIGNPNASGLIWNVTW